MNFRFLIYILFVPVFSLASIKIPISGSNTDLSLTSGTAITLNVTLKTGNLFLDNIELEDRDFSRIYFQGYHQSNIIGNPELPEIHELIELPQNALPMVEIVDEEIEYYYLSDYGVDNIIYPHQPSLSKLKSFNSNRSSQAA